MSVAGFLRLLALGLVAAALLVPGARAPRGTNRLGRETSPYLQQHARNPVDWYPWGEEAFARARAERRPILLSIGYATCHWCHVMEAESFEDPEIAAVLNARYVAIKVDREQRPDVDAVYLTAVQAMGQGGGWPLTVWLTPDLRPFWGGTYFPPRSGQRGVRLGFLELLQKLSDAWRERPADVAQAAGDVVERMRAASVVPAGDALPDGAALRRAVAQLAAAYDTEHGGFGGAPKFPRTVTLELLLRWQRRTGDAVALAMVEGTLSAMAVGGIHDQLAGGFHRYATDAAWRVPHFEKMLYDNALLAVAYLEAHQATSRADFADVARDTLTWIVRDMGDPGGGFWSATDADSEGVEGLYFTWTPAEIAAVLAPDDARLALAYFAVEPDGPLDGRSVLATPEPLDAVAARLGRDGAEAATRLPAIRAALSAARRQRVPPQTDRKVVAAWNGLAISALARGAQVLDQPRFADAAARAASFVLGTLADRDRLHRSAVGGHATGVGYLEDYAFVTAGLLDLFEATGEARWLARARALAEAQDTWFADGAAGGWFRTASDHEVLLVREKPDADGAEPSGNSVAILNALRLYELTGEERWRLDAERGLQAFAPALEAAPQALPRMLCALDFFLDRARQIMVVSPPGGDPGALLAVLRDRFVPNRVLAVTEEGDAQRRLGTLVPLVTEKTARQGRPTAWVCERQVCQLPTSDPAALAHELDVVVPLE